MVLWHRLEAVQKLRVERLAGGGKRDLIHLRPVPAPELRHPHVCRLAQTAEEGVRKILEASGVEAEIAHGRRARKPRRAKPEPGESLGALDGAVEPTGKRVVHGATIPTSDPNAGGGAAGVELFARITGSQAALVDLSDRGLIRVGGSDRARFVNGMVTNEVAALSPGSLCYAALLDAKGRLQADLFVLALEDELLLDTAPGTQGRVHEILARYVVADDVQLEDRTGAWKHIGAEGSAVRSSLSRLTLPLPEGERVEVSSWRGAPLVCVGRGSFTDGGVQIFGPAEAVEDLTGELDLPAVSPEQCEVLRVEAFHPRYGVDMTERNLPAEARLDHAISAEKGCYLGQEIVARVDSRGAVKRLLVQIRTERLVSPGAVISSDGVGSGEVTSAVVSPASGPLALGYVRPRHARPGTRLRVGESEGVVLGPPLEPGPHSD
jgi:folate-binding protein YgfZ